MPLRTIRLALTALALVLAAPAAAGRPRTAGPHVGPGRAGGKRHVVEARKRGKRTKAGRPVGSKAEKKNRPAHQKGRPPRRPRASMPAGTPRAEPDTAARRQVAGGPTADDVAAGKADPELRALRDADRVLFPRALRGATPGWSWDLPKAVRKGPEVVATGVPPGTRAAPRTRETNRAAADADWLRTLTMPNLPVRLDPRVLKYLRFYRDSSRGRAIARAWAAKSGRYTPALKASLARAGLPTDLVWLSLIESGHNPSIHSHAGAAGLWQFVPEAARIYGLTVDRWVDERLDPERSTEAAIRYLSDLHRRFGNWDLAMAAYNMGYGGMSRAIRKFNTNDFWELSRHEAGVPWETALYVPKILAIAIVMNNKKAFGISSVATDPPVEFDTIRAPSGVTLEKIAAASETPIERVKRMNPQFLRGRTPPAPRSRASKTWVVRVPKGKGLAAHSRLAKSVPNGKALEAYVAKFGDDVASIAAEHNTTSRRIRAMNGIGRDEPITQGTVLLVPTVEKSQARAAPSVDEVCVVPPRKFSYANRKRIFYRVRGEDTIATVARAFGVTSSELRIWNALAPRARFVSGMVLQIFVEPSTDLSRVRYIEEKQARILVAGSDDFFDYFEGLRGRRRIRVRAKKGDTLRKIGERYGLRVRDMERINQLSRSKTLRPGDEVVVYARRSKVIAERPKKSPASLPPIAAPKPALLPGS